MDDRTLSLKKSILARVVRIEDAALLAVVDLLLEEAEEKQEGHGAPSAASVDAILGEVARALRGGGGSSN
jgi:hypothetical protein